MEKESPIFNFSEEIPDSIKTMEQEMVKEDKEREEENLKIIQERNEKARLLIKKFSEPLVMELDDIEFKIKPITVALWDEVQGNKDDIAVRSKVVRESLITPELSEEEFNLLPAGLKYKLFMVLLQNFFLIAGRVKMKTTS